MALFRNGTGARLEERLATVIKVWCPQTATCW